MTFKYFSDLFILPRILKCVSNFANIIAIVKFRNSVPMKFQNVPRVQHV